MGSLGNRKRQLLMEELEDRCVPAVTFSVVGSTLNLFGDDDNNTIQISDNGKTTPNNVTVIADGQGLVLPAVNITTINVFAGEDDDIVTYTQTNNQEGPRTVNVHLEEGDDTFKATLPKDIRPGQTLTMTVTGDDGEDKINVNARSFGIPAGAHFNLTLDGGDDDDHIGVKHKDTVIGEIVFNAFGGDDEDTISAEFIAFDGGGAGGGGDNTIGVAGAGQGASGPSTGTIKANIFGQEDDDEITLFMRKTGASTSPLLGFADGGDDDNTLLRTPNVLFTNFDTVFTFNNL